VRRCATLSSFAIIVLLFSLNPAAQAEEIFSIFGGAENAAPPALSTPDASSKQMFMPRRPTPARSEPVATTAYCVRTCDGRYFPAPPGDHVSQAEACRNFCPATEAKPFYGTSIESSSSREGKLYSELPNAFRYRTELVPNCSCNGKSSIGLASISLEQDRTLRRGDLVANSDRTLLTSRVSGKSDISFKDGLVSMRRYSGSFAKE
jgi:uncharacterized protein DUF2865